MKASAKILYLYVGVDNVVVLFKMLHHVRRRFAFRNQLPEAELTDRRAIFHDVPVRRLTISEMLPQFGIVLAAGRMEVGRLGEIFERLARDCALRSEIIGFFLFVSSFCLLQHRMLNTARTYPDLVVDGSVVILQMFEHVRSASSFGSHFLLTQFADGEVVTHDRAVGIL